MKVAISASGETLQSPVDPRFGRCPYFIMVETDDMSINVYPNESGSFRAGAGIQAAGFLLSKGVVAVITGNCGPNAEQGFRAAGVALYEGIGGISVQSAIEKIMGDNKNGFSGDMGEVEIEAVVRAVISELKLRKGESGISPSGGTSIVPPPLKKSASTTGRGLFSFGEHRRSGRFQK